jgi:hypothetical protein
MNNYFVVDNDIGFEDNEETMNNIACVGQCVACKEQNLTKKGLQQLLLFPAKVGEEGYNMDSDFINEDTDVNQMEYTNNINSGEESYYYMRVETRNEK